jgi:hypothetical protein
MATQNDGTEKPAGSHWYGWQTLTTDGAAIALLATGVATSSAGLAEFSAATFALGGPIVHLAHERGGTAAASLGIRVGLAAVGFLGGVAAARNCGSSSGQEDDNGNFACVVEGAAIGLSVGVAGAMIIDAAFLAHEDVGREQPQRTAALSVSPTVSVTKSAGTVGLAGVF